jgi:hypothetical protein
LYNEFLMVFDAQPPLNDMEVSRLGHRDEIKGFSHLSRSIRSARGSDGCEH